MNFTYLRIDSEDGIATITINRPQQGNALNWETIRELKQAIATIRESTNTRVVVITGAGEKFFIGGADVNVLASLDVLDAERFIRALHETLRAIRDHPVPVIAAINGYALGAGLELVMSCDLAIAAEHTQLGMPEVKVGVPSVIECALLPHLIGLMRTRELLLTGDNISAQEAYRIGLVNQVVPLGELSAAVRRMAQRLMSNDQRALLLQKELMNRWLNLPMNEAIEAGIKSLALAYATDAPQRAIREFRTRRKKS